MAERGTDLLSQTEARFIAELSRREVEVERILGQTYRKAARYLEPLWMDAYQRLTDARAAGASDDYLSGLIWSEHRLAGMLHDAERLATSLLEPYGTQLQASMRDASQLAEQSFRQGVIAQLGTVRAAGVVFNRLPAAQLLTMTAHLTDGSPILSVMGRFGPGAADALKQALIEGVTNGESPSEVARRVANRLGGQYGQINVITRTEMFRVYRGTLLDTYRTNRHLVKGWRWKADISIRTCPVCWAMHGKVFDLDEPFASHPMCRCSAVPVLRPWSEIDPMLAGVQTPKPGKRGPFLFDKLSEAEQRAVLGPTGARAYRRGLFELEDLVEDTYSPIWGPGRRQRSLSSVLGPDKMRKVRGDVRQRPARASKALPAPLVKPPKPTITPAPKPRGRQRTPDLTPAPKTTPESWQPTMSREEANRWAMQGDLTRPLFHVTSPEGAAGISREGFDLSRTQWGRVWGNGAYMSDSSASARMYSAAFDTPTRIELRVNSRKTLRVDLSGQSEWGHHSLLNAIGPDAQAEYNRRIALIRDRNSRFVAELYEDYPIIPGEDYTIRGQKITAREAATNQAIREGRYSHDSNAEALTQTLQHYGYDAIDLVDEPHRESVGGSQVIVFDPKRITVVKEEP